MSTSAQPPNRAPAPAPRGVSPTTLILSLALAVCATAAIVLFVLYLRPPGSGSSAADGVLEQHDTVSPGSTPTGAVRYPIPFAAPPNLKITSPKRDYQILKQDETGFTWAAVATIDDIRDDARRDAEAMMNVGIRSAQQLGHKLKSGLRFEDFMWEAKGMRAGKDAPITLQGTFNTLPGQEAEVNFEVPFANAPNVELSGPASGSVIVVQSRPTGFKWKNVPQSNYGSVNSGAVNWKAKGLRAAETPAPTGQ